LISQSDIVNINKLTLILNVIWLILNVIWLWYWILSDSDIECYLTLMLNVIWLWCWMLSDSDTECYLTLILNVIWLILNVIWLWYWMLSDSDTECYRLVCVTSDTLWLKEILSTTIVIFSYPKLLSFSVLTFIKWRLNTELLANTLRNVVFSI
jgi:hypothetical protein